MNNIIITGWPQINEKVTIKLEEETTEYKTMNYICSVNSSDQNTC